MQIKKILPILLRVGVHLGALLPLVVLLIDYQTHNLSVNPIQTIEQRSGDTALVLLLLSLVCTPLQRLTGYAPILQRRRALGLYAFGYASLHLLVFVGIDYGLDWGEIWRVIVQKPFIVMGMAAFLMLLPLAITSFTWWMHRLGKNWKRLHRFVYLTGGLVVIHFGWSVKGDFLRLSGDVQRPLLAGVVLLVLLGLRLVPMRRIRLWLQHLRKTDSA